MKLKELTHYTGEILQVERFRDYCPNGLQVEGKSEIKKIVAGVSASLDLLEAAHAANADLILVHHGYFWRNEDTRVVGLKRARLKFLLERDISLLAYHLPLDAHSEYGNNVQLAKMLGFNLAGFAGEQNMIAYGELDSFTSLEALGMNIQHKLNRIPLIIGDPNKQVKQVAWCTGAAQDYIDRVIDLEVDVFISGEISERTVHLARESGVAYIAAGHHATERYGVQALGQHLATCFNLEYEFIDIDNPV
jgi:dinuclear metal center YbgI/SA1388 family protein